MRKNIILLWVCIQISTSLALDFKKEIELEKKWRFEIGDNMAYSKADFNDVKWDSIDVPEPWENQGFPGYNGFAWYRITFRVPEELRQKALYLKLGRVDGTDMTFLNGKLIGKSGQFPPDYKSAYQVKRRYIIPPEFIRFGTLNTLAVRVFDKQNEGGIVDGDIGIYSRIDKIKFEIDLNGYWKFKPGDDLAFSEQNYKDKKWTTILVPDKWENQGFRELNGFAWYRKEVIFSKDISQYKLILMLGKINDVDEVYLNGKSIGKTGYFPEKDKKPKYNNIHKQDRAYFIPPQFIRVNQKNIIAVRVYDVGGSGGIYDGEVGIVKRDAYLRYTKKKKERD